jgi:hypothetical protein
MPRSATEKDKHPRKDEHQTWRERNPDKYRACQRETMRRRRAAAKCAKAVVPVTDTLPETPPVVAEPVAKPPETQSEERL